MAMAFDKLYWARLAWGVLFGALAYYAQLNWNLGIINDVLLGVIGYLTSYYFARYIWYRKLEPANMSKLYTTGYGVYIMMFIFSWFLLFTLYVVKA